MMDKPVLDSDNLILKCDQCNSVMVYKLYGSKFLEVYECPGCTNTILKKDLDPEEIRGNKITIGHEHITMTVRLSNQDLETFTKYKVDIEKVTSFILRNVANSLRTTGNIYKTLQETDEAKIIKKIVAD